MTLFKFKPSVQKLIFLGFTMTSATGAHAFFLDGNGYFGMRGETRVNPDFQKDRGTYQATEMRLDLNGEVRANDRASFNLRLGIFDDRDGNYLGDSAKPSTCEPRRSADGSVDTSCEGRNQGTSNGSGYSNYKPVIREAYAKYAFNYCLLTAGRRSRDVGLGILHSSGKNPFDTDASVFDGVTCDVNIQKQQDLGFTFGFDKLQESGTWTNNPYDRPLAEPGAEGTFTSNTPNKSTRFGANNPSDDLDQIFFGITYDDRKSKLAGSFAKHVGIYFSNILGTDSKTDVKFLDLYTGLYYGNVSFRNELVFRMGKTASPDVVAMGGKRLDADGNAAATNNVQSIGLAGQFDYTLAKSGASLGPAEFNEGNATRHSLFLTYAYAPGDADGYYQDHAGLGDTTDAAGVVTKGLNSTIGEGMRNDNAKAMAFNKNYKPAMLMFNGKSTSKYLNTGGVFDSQRVTNVALYSLGYRYENQENGNFEVKLITGRLIETMPSEVKAWYDTKPKPPTSSADKTNDPYYDRPMGYSGSDLGYELDLLYTWQYRREVELGAGIAGALPGKAWEVSVENKPTTTLGLMGSFALKF